MVDWLAVVSVTAGVFITLSPVTSYLDTVLGIYRNKSSAGFSVDICGIMLVASIFKIFFYFGRPYELSLYFQAWVMVAVQVMLLRLALEYRPRHWLGGPLDPQSTASLNRPYSFWAWRYSTSYWRFLLGLSGVLALLQLAVGWSPMYVDLVGLIGVFVEAMLPLPQILTNRARGSVQGFRISLLVSWLGGDVSKIAFFLFSRSQGSSSVAPQFLICAFIQATLDIFIGLQYFMYSTGRWAPTVDQDVVTSRQRSGSLKFVQPTT